MFSGIKFKPRSTSLRKPSTRLNKGRTARSIRNRNTNLASAAYKLAKSTAKNVEVMHWKTDTFPNIAAPITFNNATAFTIDGINMTTGALAAGWAANYAGSKTGVVMYTIGHMKRGTVDQAPGYHFGNEAYIRSMLLKFNMYCNTTANVTVRMLLLKIKGALLTPEDLPFYDRSPAATTPDLTTFVDKGRSSVIQKVLIDRIIKLEKYDSTSLRESKHISLYKKLNTKYYYGVPTDGLAGTTGTPSGVHDLADGSPSYVLVFTTDSPTTGAVNIYGNMLINYVP